MSNDKAKTTITAVSPRNFKVNMASNTSDEKDPTAPTGLVDIKAGVQEVHQAVLDHPYAKANGLVAYDGKDENLKQLADLPDHTAAAGEGVTEAGVKVDANGNPVDVSGVPVTAPGSVAQRLAAGPEVADAAAGMPVPVKKADGETQTMQAKVEEGPAVTGNGNQARRR